MIVTNLPIWLVDVAGSAAMIVLALMCLRMVLRLKGLDQRNVIWTYLAWVCSALCLFAFSRGAGHILKQVLVLAGQTATWEAIRPVSGSINTLSFMVVASVTLFFQRTWNIYRDIQNDKRALQTLSDELLYLNRHLEQLVAERTKEVAVSERRYRRIFETSKDIILVTDRKGRIRTINPAGRETLGVGLEGREPVFFGNCFVNGTDWAAICRSLDEEGALSNAEVALKAGDGASVRVLISGRLEKETAAADDTFHFLIKDIEQLRRIEQQMVQADKLASIGELSAGIAHEINNPLGIILGYTQLMRRNEPAGSQRHEDLRTIEKHVRSCKTIVEDLLNFARSAPPSRAAVDLHSLIDEVLHFLGQHAGLDQVRIQKDYDASAPALQLDEKKIRQVVVNLVMNAVHAVGAAGVITIATRLDAAGRVLLKVGDNGCGIEKKNLARIFDPFFTTKPTGQGTGLGLSVSYGIIKSHGGDIQVESAPGKGATFTVVLPVVKEETGNGPPPGR